MYTPCSIIDQSTIHRYVRGNSHLHRRPTMTHMTVGHDPPSENGFKYALHTTYFLYFEGSRFSSTALRCSLPTRFYANKYFGIVTNIGFSALMLYPVWQPCPVRGRRTPTYHESISRDSSLSLRDVT